ncbi:MAG: small ribosomal subunit Rsm22 family protein [Nitrospira sp.]|nr:small ribosomal subunit Rsm22 family protein [Nitrospira sp.]
MYQLSPAVLNAIATVARINILDHHRSTPQSVIDGVSRLSDMFTRSSDGVGRPYFEEPQLGISYLAYYVPVNLAKVQLLLDELQPVSPTVPGEEFRVLDIGGGPGTGVLAVLDWCHARAGSFPSFLPSLRMTVVDRSPQALRLCADVWQTYNAQPPNQPIPPLRTIEGNLERSFPPVLRQARLENGYHLIIVQNILSELFIDNADPIKQRTGLVEELLGCLSPEGSLMIIEPALRSASRDLHQVRDNLLAGQHCSVYSPCLHDAPCPALVKPDDWCHEERKWEIPAWIAQVDREVGFIKDALKFSYVILRKDGKTLVSRNTDYHRVVSELRVMKGEKRVWLCDETGRFELGRQDKERSTANAGFEDWHRGAIIRVSEIVRKERKGRPAMVGRILSSGTAEIVRPA